MPGQDVGGDIDPRSLSELEEKARRAAVDYQAKVEVARAALELRDEKVVELYDHHVEVRRIASVMLITKSRVHQIVTARG